VKYHPHLIEERLFDCYLAESRREAIDPPTAEHLTDCAPCAARYADLVSFMDSLRTEGSAEADEIFTPERLRVQQQQIARRLRNVGHAARIISFPGRFVRRTLTSSTSRTPRWIAGAAAAGLFVGVALGAAYQRGPWSQSIGTSFARQASTRLNPGATRGYSAAQLAADDAFLSDLEVALERPHTRELIAFDALTPHVRAVR
jgi:hypothetical protein